MLVRVVTTGRVLARAHHAGQWVQICIKFEEEFAAVKLGFVENLERVLAALLGPELNDATALAAALVILENIDTDDITGLAHVVLKVLPLGVPVEVGEEDAAAPHRVLVFKQVALVKHLTPNQFALSELLTVSISLLLPLRRTLVLMPLGILFLGRRPLVLRLALAPTAVLVHEFAQGAIHLVP